MDAVRGPPQATAAHCPCTHPANPGTHQGLPNAKPARPAWGYNNCGILRKSSLCISGLFLQRTVFDSARAR